MNLKGLPYEYLPVHLVVRNGGEQLAEAYRAIYPDGLVPALLPAKPADRAHARRCAAGCLRHPSAQ